MDGSRPAPSAAAGFDELDELDLELLALLGTTGTETKAPKVYAKLERAGLVVMANAGGGVMWVGRTPKGRRFLRKANG
jgi:hypothetical protein